MLHAAAIAGAKFVTGRNSGAQVSAEVMNYWLHQRELAPNAGKPSQKKILNHEKITCMVAVQSATFVETLMKKPLNCDGLRGVLNKGFVSFVKI
jgi:hypothetical protein